MRVPARKLGRLMVQPSCRTGRSSHLFWWLSCRRGAARKMFSSHRLVQNPRSVLAFSAAASDTEQRFCRAEQLGEPAWKNRHGKNRRRGERSQEIHRGVGRNTGTGDTRLGPRLQALFCPPSPRAAAQCPLFNIISHPPASSQAGWSFSWSPPAESCCPGL